MFNAANRMTLGLSSWQRWLAADNVVCPYITVEFKCSEKTGKKSHVDELLLKSIKGKHLACDPYNLCCKHGVSIQALDG